MVKLNNFTCIFCIIFIMCKICVGYVIRQNGGGGGRGVKSGNQGEKGM